MPPSQNSDRSRIGAVRVEAPMNSTKFGCRHRTRTVSSRLKASTIFVFTLDPSLICLIATAVPRQVPRNTSAVMPLPILPSMRYSSGRISHGSHSFSSDKLELVELVSLCKISTACSPTLDPDSMYANVDGPVHQTTRR